MKLPSLKLLLLTPLLMFAVFYIAGAIIYWQRDAASVGLVDSPAAPITIAILGASGTAGDGILKAAMASADIGKIHVFSRRETRRIKDGIESGKVQMSLHQDYLDYSALLGEITEVDTVFWAIGISSLGVDEKTYGMIHVDFPMRFIEAWTSVNTRPNLSFQFISSSDISEQSSAMWVREKIRAEKSLFGLAEGSKLRVIAHRPDYIGPTSEEASLGQNLLYGFFAPVGAAVKATQIGEAMIEVSLRDNEFKNGDKLSTRRIIDFSKAYTQRHQQL